MARMAVDDGIATIITTPHQLGNYAVNTGDVIRGRVRELQQRLDEQRIPLQVLPGGDVRIEADLVQRIKRGEVLTLADHGKHVLLELPHEMYIPLEPLLDDLRHAGIAGILSHPERNQGLLEQRRLIPRLVEHGCLMQITAGSFHGRHGPQSQDMSEWMVQNGLVHFVASDAHGVKTRRPRLQPAFARIAELVGQPTAELLCCHNPRAVSEGHPVALEVKVGKRGWFGWRAA